MIVNYITFLLIMVTHSHSDTKVWIDSTEIYDPVNWKNGNIQRDCNGLIFAELNDAPSFINQLSVSQLVLPRSGTIRFEEGSSIVFDERSKSNLNCVELNPFWQKAWYNASAWKNLDDPDNLAVPFTEIPPCQYDDVIIPKGYNSSIYFPGDSVTVKSLTFGTKKLSQNELIDLLSSDFAQDVFPTQLDIYRSEVSDLLTINDEECSDPQGCDRRTEFQFDDSYYSYLIHKTPIQCEGGIIPLGNLQVPICGAQILIDTISTGFTMYKINQKLKSYESYTHASRYFSKHTIQIIFTEKEFTGQSVVEATEFHNLLKEDKSYFCDDLTLMISGPPVSESRTQVKSAVSIIFGTFVGAVLMFGLIFFAYSTPVRNLNLRNRILGTRPLSTYILRYDTMEDRGCIVDGQSMAGSVLSLNRSFENPLYDLAPSTRSTSNETVAAPKLEEDKLVTIVKEAIEEKMTPEIVDQVEEIDLHRDSTDDKSDLLLKDL